MDIAAVYVRYAQEQHDAYNPDQRLGRDEFGCLTDKPTVEGFDNWGPNQYQRPVVAPVPDLDVVRARNAEARRSLNRRIRRGW